MSKSIKADHSQIFLLPPSLEDWVSAEHPVRFIREFVKGLDLNGLGFPDSKISGPGRSGYSSELMLSVWLYGCYQRVYSSRKLEFACKNEMPMIWLTGMHGPDHNSLWRFWRDHRAAIKKIFKQTVLVADQMGMIGMVLHAIDGSKVPVVSSRRSLWNKSSLTRKSEMLDKRIGELEKEIDAQQGEQNDKMDLPDKLHDIKALKQSIDEAKAFLESEQIENHHPLEPEAKVMKNQRVYDPCYNGQVVVDAKHQIITAEKLVNDENDAHQLVPMLEMVKENLGRVADETLADSGYDSADQIQQAADLTYDVLVNDKQKKAIRENPFHSAHFNYDEDKDTLICPKGTELKFERERKGKESQGDTVRLFRCKNKECPFRNQCTVDKRGRAVEISSYRIAVQNQNIKRHSQTGKKKLQERMAIVEPVFAAIKTIRGFQRYTYKTLEKAGVQWSFMCAIHNLKKIFNLWKQKRGESMVARVIQFSKNAPLVQSISPMMVTPPEYSFWKAA